MKQPDPENLSDNNTLSASRAENLQNQAQARIPNLLISIYGKEIGEAVYPHLEQRLQEFSRRNPQRNRPADRLTQADALLITYGDQFQEEGVPPLQVLERFLNRYLANTLNGVHILPFYPYSSDDGFSVIDYWQVDPRLGSWSDIRSLGNNFRLMFDAVINHISQHSRWFQAFIRQESPYDEYFLEVDPTADLSAVVRPRALPLLTPVQTSRGLRHVWTTFSDDQIDLNYANPQVLIEILDLLLFYAANGAQLIRLDAIAYLWKETGTSSIHHENTHRVVKLFRAVLDAVAPQVILITETNVPHEENISYFGSPLPGSDRTDEAQLVYQFPLGPLVLHSFLSGSALALSTWAAGLKTPTPGTTFFNFIASHDGIGLRPAEGLLQPAELQALVDQALAHGGQVSYRSHPDGSKSVYELNITLYDMLNDPGRPDLEVDIRRFLASQAVMLALAGVPGIYVHSLFGSRSCQPCYQETGRARSLNRQKFQLAEIEARLAQPDHRETRVFSAYRRLLLARRKYAAFDPAASQQVLFLVDSIFALLRSTPDARAVVLCLVNVSAAACDIDIDLKQHRIVEAGSWQDAISGKVFNLENHKLKLQMAAFETLWLAPIEPEAS